MATMHPDNPTSQFPDHVDHHSKASRPHFTRGGGGGRGGGGRGSCHRCGDPGHYIRDCPLAGSSSSRNYVRRGNHAPGNDSSRADIVDLVSDTIIARTKQVNASTGILPNPEPAKQVYKELPPKNVDVSPFLAKIKNSEPAKQVYKEVPPKSVDVSPFLTKIKSKEKEVELLDRIIDKLRSQLNKATSELSDSKAKNEEMVLDMKKSREDLEKCRKGLLYFRDRDKEVPPKSVDVSPFLTKIKSKEKEVELLDRIIDGLRSQLNKATSELSDSKAKYEEMVLDMKKSREDLEKCRKDLLYFRDRDKEMNMKWRDLNNVFEETKDGLNEKIKELEEENECAESEMMKMKVETEQWRKAAKAISSVLVGDAEICSKTTEVESLVLYYSDRAAKRMSLGKTRKALDDCRMATRLDPGFLKACLMAGNCHLIFGEINDALNNYKKCLDTRTVCLDRRLTIEAYDGLQKAERVASIINQSTELLQQKTCESASSALEAIMEALSISCYSEKLLELKGEALFTMRKYEEVVQMCEQTIFIAEKNCPTKADSNQMSAEDQIRPLKIWRWNLISRSYFRMAKFDLALAILEKYEQLAPPQTKTQGPSALSAGTIHELFRSKSAGNEAFQAAKYREAVSHYSNAIKQSIESRPFTAICLCNRAAALQAMGEVMDAIADCNLAIALDEDYMKAISRRASLHEKIRDYEQATLDFQRLISLLEKRSEKNYVEELRVARRRLSSLNTTMKKGMTMDLYIILGLKGSESGPEIKKAYHKAALRHHPDKAGKFLARSESGTDGHVWKEILTTIYTDANKLFKTIGTAYSILSDTNKRFKYNLEESMKDDFEY